VTRLSAFLRDRLVGPLRRKAGWGRFLHGTLPSWATLPLALVLAALVLLATGQPVLAREVRRRAVTPGQRQSALRRVSFYLRRSWLRLNLSRDPMYVFCTGLNRNELHALRRFLIRGARRAPPGQTDCDLAYTSAVGLLSDAGGGWTDVFRADADRAFQGARHRTVRTARTPKTWTPAGFAPLAARQALTDFAHAMGRANLPWFVISGTFLGAVRDGGFLPHDTDIDIGVMSGDVDADDLARQLSVGGAFQTGPVDRLTVIGRDPEGRGHRVQHPVSIKLAHRDGVTIDVFLHHRDGATIWHASDLFRWDNTAFDLAPYVIDGLQVMGPADADRYLTENYGNWRVPVTTFNSALQTPNLVLVQNPLSVAIFLRRLWLADDDEQAARLTELLQRSGIVGPDDRITSDLFR
jgi:hypothetical protein